LTIFSFLFQAKKTKGSAKDVKGMKENARSDQLERKLVWSRGGLFKIKCGKYGEKENDKNPSFLLRHQQSSEISFLKLYLNP
jgi:hypothetical protein